MIELFGVAIHDPDVVFTDLGLAALGAFLGWRLWNHDDRGTLGTAGVVLFLALASAALWGAVYHAFFPAGTTTTAGVLVWLPVPLSIAVAGATLVDLVIRLAAPRAPRLARRALVATYAAVFAVVVLLVDASFTTIVRFYTPPLAVFLLAATREALRGRAGWTLVAFGLVASALAAVAQQAGLAVHPTHFDHNAVYHVLQGGAVVILYLGFRRARLDPGSRSTPGPAPGPTPGS